jgi:hypothetical protein
LRRATSPWGFWNGYTNSDGVIHGLDCFYRAIPCTERQHSGGSSGYGTVFKLNTDGTSFVNLHTFDYGSDGAYPEAGVILSGNTLYGTAWNGGNPLMEPARCSSSTPLARVL